MNGPKPQQTFAKEPSRYPAASALGDSGEIVELVYDPSTRTTAFAVWKDGHWMPAPTFDLGPTCELVPYSPNNNLVKTGAVVLPSEPTEYGTEAELLEDIQSFVHRYVDLSPAFEQLSAHYVLFSWLHDAFNELPYLRFRGDYGTGKTRALLILGSLCYKAFFASGASTVSPIFHTLDAFRGTLILDEADFRFSDEKAEIVKILNNGNVAGLPVLRTVVSPKHEFNPRAFHVFGPKIVATRGRYEDKALESRFLTEETGGRSLRTDIPINLPPTYKDEALLLRNKLLMFRFRNRADARINPDLIDRSLEPRMNQILIPLQSIIADAAHRDEVRGLASALHRSVVSDRSFSPEAQVLALLDELSREQKASIAIRLVTERFMERHGAEYARPVTGKWIGQLIRDKLRLATYKTSGSYVVPMTELEKIESLKARFGLADAPDVSSSTIQ